MPARDLLFGRPPGPGPQPITAAQRSNTQVISEAQLQQVVSGYLDAALWATTDEAGIPLDSNYSREDFTAEAYDRAWNDCEKMITPFLAQVSDGDFSLLGHNFWLSRQRTGGGFDDLDFAPKLAAKLDQAAQECGEVFLWAEGDSCFFG